MSKQIDNNIKETLGASLNKFGRISKKSNIVLTSLLGLISILTIAPFILVMMLSISSSKSIDLNGYKFIPSSFSLSAYKMLFDEGAIFKSFGDSLIITVVGTIIGLFLMSTFAYVLSRKSFAYNKSLTVFSFIPMLFSGGLIGNYLIVVNVLGLRNSIWALILPLSMSTFSIIILRTFYKMSIPDSIIESAYMDGASEWRIYFRIILPLSLPGLATIALFLTLGYWNDWFNAMLYIDDQSIMPLQYLLISMERNLDFLIKNSQQLGVENTLSNLPKDTIKMAVVVISTAPILIVYPFFQRYFIGGLTLGAVKE